MKKAIKVIVIILAAVVVIAGIFLAVMSIAEYRPEDVETVEVEGASSAGLSPGGSLSVMSWNIGYGALGDDADFFMDGGEDVMSSDEERVLSNMEGITEEAAGQDADVYFFQETDRDSKRSYNTDEASMITEAFKGYESSFANNYKALYVPYPWPPIGKVDSGLLTLSSFEVSGASRISLPCPFSWPIRTCNLKRCLLISRVPLEGSDRELVLINLHLEAYDSGEGKIEQTKELVSVLTEELKKGNYVIAGGDFNQTFSDVDLSPYPQGEGLWQPGVIDVSDLGEGFTALMDNRVPSCRLLNRPYAGADKEDFQYYMIDGFIVSDNIDVTSMRTLDRGFACSDHNPVLLKARLKK